VCPFLKRPCQWPCKAYEIKVCGINVESLSIENYVVKSTLRKGHYQVVPRKDNKKKFWETVFELREKGNLSSTTLKSFKFETKTFYESINYMNFCFTEAVKEAKSPENIQIFTEISEN
jgi:hypothetical protein